MPANPTSGNPATDGCVTCEMDHRRVLIDKLRTENTRLAAENERLLARQQELLATIVRVTNETPYPEEIQGWQSQRSAMIAEVGSLKAEVIGLKRALLASERERDQYMAAVVENGTRADSLAAKLGECEKERDALRSHYDRAAPEHNLLALLDLYAERESAACAECERMRAVYDAAKTWCETVYIGKPHPRFPAYPGDELLHAVNAAIDSALGGKGEK